MVRDKGEGIGMEHPLKHIRPWAAVLLGVSALANPAGAQQAPISPAMSRAVINWKPGASKANKRLVRDAVRNVLAERPGLVRLRVSSVPLTAEEQEKRSEGPASTKLQVDEESQEGSGVALGATVASSDDESEGGLVPALTLRGRRYALVVGWNTASRQTIESQAEEGSGDDDSAAREAFGSALLNSGTATQSFNVLFFRELKVWAGKKQSQATSVADDDGPKALKHDLGTPQYTLEREVYNEIRAAITKRKAAAADSGTLTDAKERESTTDANTLIGATVGEPGSEDSSVIEVSQRRLGLFSRIGIAGLDFKGETSEDDSAIKTISGHVFAPAIGLQYLIGGSDKNEDELQFGVEAGYTWRYLFGNIAQDGNRPFRVHNFSSGRTHFSGPEITFFAKWKDQARPYVRYTDLSPGNLASFSGSQVVIGVDIFTSFFGN
jgi:hypothetical protein